MVQKNTTYIITFLTLFGIVFISGCVGSSGGINAELPDNLIVASLCDVTDEESFINACYTAKAMQNSSYCERTSSPDSCYLETVEYKKDASLCEKFWPVGNCTESEYSYSDNMYCYQQQGLREGCYSALAIDTNNINLCGKIENHISNTACRAGVRKDESICEEENEHRARDICYLAVALVKKDLSICDNIHEKWSFAPINKDVCYDSVIAAKGDLIYCEERSYDSDFKRERCYKGIFESIIKEAIMKNSASVCERIKDQKIDNHTVDLCYRVFEGADYYATFCMDYRSACYHNLAILNKNPSLCSKIVSEGEYAYEEWNCYETVAILKQDKSICDKIPTDSSKSKKSRAYCYRNVAISKEDSSICDSIDVKYAHPKYECYSIIGKKTGNTSLCKKIEKKMEEYGSEHPLYSKFKSLNEECLSKNPDE